MKNIKYFKFIFILSLLIVGCNENESTDLVEPNHRVIVTSEMNFDNTINIDGHIDFGDISQGVQSRVWTFPADASSIAGEKGNTSSKNVVKGFFTKSGVYDVVLNQTFKGNVYPNEDSLEPINGVELDTTIVVTVLDNVLAKININHINEDGSTGAPLSLSDNAENTITASEYVRLSQASDGSPSNFTWTLNGAKPEIITSTEPDGEIDVRYIKLGTWDLNFIASRTRPTDSDTITIKNFIKVIPSTKPVTLERIFEKSTDKIGLEFSREMDPNTINKSDYSVSIETAAAGVITPTISSVTVDNVDGNVVVITLDQPYYNDDVVKVSYALGNLTTLDAVAATAFTDEILTDIIKTNILESSSYDYSFENSTDGNWQYLGWGTDWDGFTWTLSSNQSQEGSKSAYIEIAANDGMIVGHRDLAGQFIRFPTQAGKMYEIGAWVYVTDLGNYTTGNLPDLRFYWNPGTDWGVGSNPAFTSDFSINKWVYASFRTNKLPSGDASFMLRGYNATNPEPLKFYLDNITVAELKLRP